jgi:hypothetical protein
MDTKVSILKTYLSDPGLSNELKALLVQADSVGLADALNIKNVPVKKPILTHDIKQYLMLVDLLIPIENAATPSCEVAEKALSEFESFDVRNPIISNKYNAILNGLVSDPLVPDFTDSHKAYLLALGDAFESISVVLTGESVSELEIRQAIWNDDGTRAI